MDFLKKVLPYIIIAIVFALGGFYVGKGALNNQGASVANIPGVTKLAASNCAEGQIKVGGKCVTVDRLIAFKGSSSNPALKTASSGSTAAFSFFIMDGRCYESNGSGNYEVPWGLCVYIKLNNNAYAAMISSSSTGSSLGTGGSSGGSIVYRDISYNDCIGRGGYGWTSNGDGSGLGTCTVIKTPLSPNVRK